MAKLLKGIMKDGQRFWVIAPNAGFDRDLRSGTLSYLSIFYKFALLLIQSNKTKKQLSVEEVAAAQSRILIELDNKVSKLKFLARELSKHEKKLKQRRDIKKNIYDYKPYQVMIGLIEDYLNTVHSIREVIYSIDKAIGKRYSEKIWKEEWFRIQLDLRNLFHHVESPLCTVDRNKIILTFKRIEELRNPKYYKVEMKDENGRLEVEFESGDILDDMIIALDSWAEQHMNRLDKESEMEFVTRIEKDGKIKSKKRTLREVLKMISKS